jgi:hypothetical protein
MNRKSSGKDSCVNRILNVGQRTLHDRPWAACKHEAEDHLQCDRPKSFISEDGTTDPESDLDIQQLAELGDQCQIGAFLRICHKTFRRYQFRENQRSSVIVIVNVTVSGFCTNYFRRCEKGGRNLAKRRARSRRFSLIDS